MLLSVLQALQHSGLFCLWPTLGWKFPGRFVDMPGRGFRGRVLSSLTPLSKTCAKILPRPPGLAAEFGFASTHRVSAVGAKLTPTRPGKGSLGISTGPPSYTFGGRDRDRLKFRPAHPRARLGAGIRIAWNFDRPTLVQCPALPSPPLTGGWARRKPVGHFLPCSS
jgi:hypothetical protein